MRPPRFRLRTLMVAVAAVTILLLIARRTIHIWESLPGRPWNSMLSVGQPVIIVAGTHVEAIDGPETLAPETRCIVVREPAWDSDSCYPIRGIVVRIARGDEVGLVVEIPRNRLRPE